VAFPRSGLASQTMPIEPTVWLRARNRSFVVTRMIDMADVLQFRSGGSTNDGPFTWRRISPLKDWFELCAGEQVLARLMIKGLLIIAAQVDTEKRRIVFEGEGIGTERILIYEAGEELLLIAQFDRRISGHAGTLRFADGGELEWRRLGRWWKPVHVFSDRFGNPLLRFHPDGTAEGYIFRTNLTDCWEDLMLLLSLGWFLLIISGGAAPPKLSGICGR